LSTERREALTQEHVLKKVKEQSSSLLSCLSGRKEGIHSTPKPSAASIVLDELCFTDTLNVFIPRLHKLSAKEMHLL